MNKQTQIIYNLVVVILALVGVIVVLALYVVGVFDFEQTQEKEHAPEPAEEHAVEPTDELPAPTPESQTPEEPEPEPEPTPAPITAPAPQPAQQQTQPIQQTQPFNDKDCGDFQTHAQAQAFFESQGGPAQDPHKLDRNKDGVVCESLL